jgi:hypothetical protein
MNLMEESSSPANPEQATAGKQASEAQARIVYMYSDLIRQRDPYCHRLD